MKEFSQPADFQRTLSDLVVDTPEWRAKLDSAAANFIEANTGDERYLVESMEEVPVSNMGIPYGIKMILIDARDRTRDDLIDFINSQLWRDYSHNMLVLYNVRQSDNIEKNILRNGARGILYNDGSMEDLTRGICAVNSGEFWFSRRVMSECLQESFIGKDLLAIPSHSLSDREVEIIRTLATGESNAKIAAKMYISPHTVKTHLHSIFHKIDVTNRVEAVLWANGNCL